MRAKCLVSSATPVVKTIPDPTTSSQKGTASPDQSNSCRTVAPAVRITSTITTAWTATAMKTTSMARRSGRNERLGATRYQWPSSMPASALPDTSLAGTNAITAVPTPPSEGPNAAAAFAIAIAPKPIAIAPTTRRATSVITEQKNAYPRSATVNAIDQWNSDVCAPGGSGAPSNEVPDGRSASRSTSSAMTPAQMSDVVPTNPRPTLPTTSTAYAAAVVPAATSSSTTTVAIGASAGRDVGSVTARSYGCGGAEPRHDRSGHRRTPSQPIHGSDRPLQKPPPRGSDRRGLDHGVVHPHGEAHRAAPAPGHRGLSGAQPFVQIGELTHLVDNDGVALLELVLHPRIRSIVAGNHPVDRFVGSPVARRPGGDV